MYRCTERTEPADAIMGLAALIPNPWPEPDWSRNALIRCMQGDEAHDYHAGWLRNGGRKNTDLFVCWRAGGAQWLEDSELCLSLKTKNGQSCTLFLHHGGPCTWALIDTERIAAVAEADQLMKDWGISIVPPPQIPPR